MIEWLYLITALFLYLLISAVDFGVPAEAPVRELEQVPNTADIIVQFFF